MAHISTPLEVITQASFLDAAWFYLSSYFLHKVLRCVQQKLQDAIFNMISIVKVGLGWRKWGSGGFLFEMLTIKWEIHNSDENISLPVLKMKELC